MTLSDPNPEKIGALLKLLQIDFEYYPELDSTNKKAKEIAEKNQLAQDRLIMAGCQTGGYGRYGRSFSSPAEGGIYLSLIHRLPAGAPLNPGLITTAAAVAVSRTIYQQLDLDPQIKWVNDILVDGQKVCGILAEAVLDSRSQAVKAVVLGIGINYLTPEDSFAPALLQRVGTLKRAAEQAGCSLTDFTIQLCSNLNELLGPDISASDFMPEYRRRSAVIGRQVTLTLGEHKISGLVKDINDQGELVLADGQVFGSGKVTKVR